MKTLQKVSFAILIIALLAGCSASQSTVGSGDIQKTLTPPEGKALLYIVRPQGMGFAITFEVSIDGTYIGKTNGKRYLYTYKDPGKINLASRAENNAELQIVLEAGKVYFIEQIPQMGIIMARNKLVVLNEEEGRTKLKKCKLAGDNVQK